MAITRAWLSWDEPCLPQAAAWLIDRAETGDDARVCDLRRWLCVLPGERAGRLLLAELLRQCDERKLRLVPPRTLTPGAMVEEVLDVRGALASELESRWAWIAALRNADADVLRPLFRHAPAADDLAAWSDLAATLARLHDQLAGELRSFAEAADAVERQERILEGERWRAIGRLRERQKDALAHAGLVDRHDAREAALQRAIRAAAEGSLAPHRIALVGVTDLNRLQRAALAIASHDVTALVHAPPAHAGLFDDAGCVAPQAWRERRIEIPDDAIINSDRPADMAQAALRAVDQLAGEYNASQIAVAVGDASLSAEIAVAARWAGLATHDAAGHALSRTAPWRMLEAACDWIEDQRFEHFAALLRHADIERAVQRVLAADPQENDIGVEDWLTLLDEYFEDHLQGRFAGDWLGAAPRTLRLQAVHRTVGSLLAPLHEQGVAARPLGEWCGPILQTLANVYGVDESADGGRLRDVAELDSIDACFEMRSVLAEIHGSAPGLQPAAAASAALRLILAECAAASIATRREHDAIEVMGWLELPLDPAPAAIVVGVNDGWIPDAVTSDAFLPDGLRRSLGLLDNDRRYARDACVLETCLHSRSRVALVVGRRSAQGDPLAPSRLLLACDERALVKRVKAFTSDVTGDSAFGSIGLASPASTESKFVVPRLPRPVEIPAAMSVTAFRAFLNCPYRYALEKLLRLQAHDDSADELDALGFGDIAHRVLCSLGESPAIIECDDRQRVFEHLDARLTTLIERDFGFAPLPAVRLQMARLRQRLWSLAGFQSQSVRDGWRIRHCEIEFDKEVALVVPGQKPMPLIGKIDRIDEHPATGAWRVIDYKTGDHDRTPTQAHHEGKRVPDDCTDEKAWVDLQLPLYHHLVTQGRTRLPTEHVRTGYIVLPRQSDGARWIEAEWEPADLQHAIERAVEIVRRIRAGAFDVDRRSLEVDAEFDAFARICQTTAFTRDDDDDDEEAGDA